MTIKTCQITNPDIPGVAGRARVPVTLISYDGTVEVLVPQNWWPSRRAGLGPWQEVRLFSNGSKAYQTR